MMLQAQARAHDRCAYYENRECSTPREAADFRAYFERLTGKDPEGVLVVSLCGAAAVKVTPLPRARGRR